MTTPRHHCHPRGWDREPPRKQLFVVVSFPLALLQSTTPSIHDPHRRAAGRYCVVRRYYRSRGGWWIIHCWQWRRGQGALVVVVGST
jgi:hypothetical protein